MSIPEPKSALDTLTPEEYAHRTVLFRTKPGRRTVRLYAAMDMMRAMGTEKLLTRIAQAGGLGNWKLTIRVLDLLESREYITKEADGFFVTRKGSDLLEIYRRQFKDLHTALDAITLPKENEDYDRK